MIKKVDLEVDEQLGEDGADGLSDRGDDGDRGDRPYDARRDIMGCERVRSRRAAGEAWHLPAHLAIVPSRTTAAARVDLLELRGASLSLLVVRFRSLSLSTHTRVRHGSLAGLRTRTVQDASAMAAGCEPLAGGGA